jgi:hypothetical protein
MQHSWFFAASLVCLVPSLWAGPITYGISVNTASITGTVGSLDFNFNPGPLATQAASLQILGFSSNGTLGGSPVLTGDVSGALPLTLTFDNETGFNDYFEGFTFGTDLDFEVSLYGPALSSPDGVSTSGSTFAFSMFSDAAGTTPALTSDTSEGFAVTVDVNLDGSTTLDNFSSQTTVAQKGMGGVPEPGPLPLIGLGIGLCIASRVRMRRCRQAENGNEVVSFTNQEKSLGGKRDV